MPTRTFPPGDTVPQFTVGSRGDWIISAPGVLPQHLLLFFDGGQIHAASLDETTPAYLKGVALPRAWRIVPHLGEVKFGQASLRVLHRVIPSQRPSAPEPPRPAKGPHNTQFFEDYQAELEHKLAGPETKFLGQMKPYVDVPQESGEVQSVLRPLPQGVIRGAADPPSAVPVPAAPPPLIGMPPGVPAAPVPAGVFAGERTVASNEVVAQQPAPPANGLSSPTLERLDAAAAPAPPGGRMPGAMPPDMTVAPTADAPPLPAGFQFAEVPPLPLPSAKDDEEPFSTVYAGDELRDFVANIPPPPQPPGTLVGAQRLSGSSDPAGLGPAALEPPAIDRVASDWPIQRPSMSPAGRAASRWRVVLLVALPLLFALVAIAVVWFLLIAR